MRWTPTDVAEKKRKKNRKRWALNCSLRLSLLFHLLQYIDCFSLSVPWTGSKLRWPTPPSLEPLLATILIGGVVKIKPSRPQSPSLWSSVFVDSLVNGAAPRVQPQQKGSTFRDAVQSWLESNTPQRQQLTTICGFLLAIHQLWKVGPTFEWHLGHFLFHFTDYI